MPTFKFIDGADGVTHIYRDDKLAITAVFSEKLSGIEEYRALRDAVFSRFFALAQGYDERFRPEHFTEAIREDAAALRKSFRPARLAIVRREEAIRERIAVLEAVPEGRDHIHAETRAWLRSLPDTQKLEVLLRTGTVDTVEAAFAGGPDLIELPAEHFNRIRERYQHLNHIRLALRNPRVPVTFANILALDADPAALEAEAADAVATIQPERDVVADGVTYLQHVVNVVALVTSLPAQDALDLIA